MCFITVPNTRLSSGEVSYIYPETINIDNIVSFCDGRIDLVNGSYVPTTKETTAELKKFLIKKGIQIVKLGESND